MSHTTDYTWVDGLIKELQNRISELEAWQKEAVATLEFLTKQGDCPDYLVWWPKAEKLINQAKETSDEVSQIMGK